jgi:hypothetical protein
MRRQDKTRHGKTRHNKTRKEKTTKDKTRQGKTVDLDCWFPRFDALDLGAAFPLGVLFAFRQDKTKRTQKARQHYLNKLHSQLHLPWQ